MGQSELLDTCLQLTYFVFVLSEHIVFSHVFIIQFDVRSQRPVFPGRQMGCLYLRRKRTRADLCPGFPEGPKWQISKNGGVQPRWRGDGKELFHRSADQSVMAVELRLGAAVEAGTPKALFQAPRNNFDDAISGINYAMTRDGQQFIVLTAPLDRSPEALTAVLNWTSLLRR